MNLSDVLKNVKHLSGLNGDEGGVELSEEEFKWLISEVKRKIEVLNLYTVTIYDCAVKETAEECALIIELQKPDAAKQIREKYKIYNA